MRATLYDLSLVDHQYLVDGENRAQLVRNDQTGPSCHDPFECMLDQLLVLRIEMARGLVQDQDSLFRRDIISPVFVLVKNRMLMRCMWA